MRRYPDSVTEAIWTLLCEGLTTREIHRRLNSGEAGVAAINPPMPRRTLNDKIANLKRQRGLPSPSVRPGKEQDTSRRILRKLLEAAGRQEARLTAASKTRMLTPAESAALDKCARTVLDIERRLVELDKAREAEPEIVTSVRRQGHAVGREGNFLQDLARQSRPDESR